VRKISSEDLIQKREGKSARDKYKYLVLISLSGSCERYTARNKGR